jgi:hypothetical protein
MRRVSKDAAATDRAACFATSRSYSYLNISKLTRCHRPRRRTIQ